MGGGFMLAERADLRVAVHGAVFEMSEAKRWLLGGFNHGHIGGLSHTVATEMAFAFRFDADRLYELGFLNRVVDDDQLMADVLCNGRAPDDTATRGAGQHAGDDARDAAECPGRVTGAGGSLARAWRQE